MKEKKLISIEKNRSRTFRSFFKFSFLILNNILSAFFMSSFHELDNGLCIYFHELKKGLCIYFHELKKGRCILFHELKKGLCIYFHELKNGLCIFSTEKCTFHGKVAPPYIQYIILISFFHIWGHVTFFIIKMSDEILKGPLRGPRPLVVYLRLHTVHEMVDSGLLHPHLY